MLEYQRWQNSSDRYLPEWAPNRQLMTYWLQELQQKRWEYCNSLDMVKWDSRTSPTPGDFSKGLVARDNTVLLIKRSSITQYQSLGTIGNPAGKPAVSPISTLLAPKFNMGKDIGN
eukprot:bmy_13466T0